MRTNDDAAYAAGLLALTVATGVIDAVSFLALDGTFSGNMTGNVLFIGIGLADWTGSLPWSNLVALAAFVLGATLAGRVVRDRARGARLSTAHVLLQAAAASAVVALALVWMLLGEPPHPWSPVATGVLAAAMGMQAVVARGALIPDVTTVVITSTLVNLALDSPFGDGTAPTWPRRVAAVVAMASGGALGALLVNLWSAATALAVAAACMGGGAAALARARRRERATAIPSDP